MLIARVARPVWPPGTTATFLDLSISYLIDQHEDSLDIKIDPAESFGPHSKSARVT